MLTIKKLQDTNRDRCEQDFRPVDAWLGSQYGNAIAGEVGELCNIIKKIERQSVSGDEKLGPQDIGKELADVICYACLIASKYNIDLEQFVIHKFNEVSDRVNSKFKL